MNVFNLYNQIRALLKIRKEGEKFMEEIKEKKAGWKTSEFWLGLIGMASTIAVVATPFVPMAMCPWLITATTVITVGYTVARTIAKATPSKADDAFLDALAARIAPLVKLPTDTSVVVVNPPAAAPVAPVEPIK